MSPTARSLNLLRRSGFLADVCERWLPHVNRRKDLFGAFDVIGVHPVRREVLFVQVTTVSNLASRVKKVRGNANVPGLLAAGVKVQVHGWDANRLKAIEVSGLDLDAVIIDQPKRRRPQRYRQDLLF